MLDLAVYYPSIDLRLDDACEIQNHNQFQDTGNVIVDSILQ